MGLGDDVKQIASDVGSAVGGVVSDTAKAVAKTPLDILEEILGGKPSSGGPGSSSQEKTPDQLEKQESGNTDPAQQAMLQQRMQEDQVTRQQKIRAHQEFMASQQAYYDQSMAQERQQKEVEKQQHEEQKKFEIKQLEKQKRENLQVQMAKDAANAEKAASVGAG